MACLAVVVLIDSLVKWLKFRPAGAAGLAPAGAETRSRVLTAPAQGDSPPRGNLPHSP